MAKKLLISSARRKVYEADAKTIAYWRRNPIIACRDLLGIELLDYQKAIIQGSWTASHVIWCCGRDTGKSFCGDIFLQLWGLLFFDQEMFILSSVGDQSKETFSKLESLVRRTGKTAASFRDLKDIAAQETVKSPTNQTGFNHNPSGYSVGWYNGSKLKTLNSNPDAARSRRASIVFFDEAAFTDDELIVVGEAFAVQDSGFVTSTDVNYDPTLEPLQPPTKLIYASSQDSINTTFYKHYIEYTKRMLAGDRDYFVVDFTADIAMNTYMYGKPYAPLLTQAKVDQAMKANPQKARREYYNEATSDAGASAIVRWGTIRKNETFKLPALGWEPGYEYAIAFDPARIGDNSIVGVMRMYEHEQYGWMGEICHCVNFVDTEADINVKLDSNRQLAGLRKILIDFSGNTAVDYEYITQVLIDAGAGGGGLSTYSDGLLNDWTDDGGHTHHGLIDTTYGAYASSTYQDLYPNAIDKLRVINPRTYRNQMFEEFIDLSNSGLIRYPSELDGDTISYISGQDKNGEDIWQTKDLNDEEILSLKNIDLMKTELTSIAKTENAARTVVTYAMTRESTNTGHDDRAYVAIMLAHCLYQKRKGAALDSRKVDTDEEILRAPLCVSALPM